MHLWFSQEEALKLFDYNPETGIVVRKSNGRAILPRPGVKYLYTTVHRRKIRLHTLIYYMMTGEFWQPVDHKDRDTLNNRWKNLRKTSHSTNIANNPDRRTHLPRGVSLHQSGRYMARISVDNKGRHLGYFDTPEAAHARFMVEHRKVHPDLYT